jgi:transcriptional regulator with XRE-family HTH domain
MVSCMRAVQREKLGEYLRAKRLGRGLTRPEAAKALGVPEGSLRNWEQGRVAPSVLVLPAMVEVLGFSLSEWAESEPLDPAQVYLAEAARAAARRAVQKAAAPKRQDS